MDDLEMIRLCAEAMNLHFGDLPHQMTVNHDYKGPRITYDPLHDDAQAMALVKRFRLAIDVLQDGAWTVCWRERDQYHMNVDLNRAIVECVAKMRADEQKG